MCDTSITEITADERARLCDYLRERERVAGSLAAPEVYNLLQQVEFLHDEVGEGCALVLTPGAEEFLREECAYASFISGRDVSAGNELYQALAGKAAARADAFLDSCAAILARIEDDQRLARLPADGHTVAGLVEMAADA